MRWTFGVSDYTCIQILAQPFISQLWHTFFLRGTHYFYEGFTLADYFYEALIISTRDLHLLFLRRTHQFYEGLIISKLMRASIHTQIYISQVLSINWAFGVTVGFMHTCTRQLLFKYAHIPRLAQARPRIPRFYPGPGFIHDRTRIEPGSGLNCDPS